MKEIKNIAQDAATILNGIRAQASQTYKDTVPIYVPPTDTTSANTQQKEG